MNTEVADAVPFDAEEFDGPPTVREMPLKMVDLIAGYEQAWSEIDRKDPRAVREAWLARGGADGTRTGWPTAK